MKKCWTEDMKSAIEIVVRESPVTDEQLAEFFIGNRFALEGELEKFLRDEEGYLIIPVSCELRREPTFMEAENRR